MVSSACTFATVSTVIQWNAFAWNIENINIIILTKIIIMIMTLSSPKWSSYYNDIVISNTPEWRQGWDSQILSPLLLSGEEQTVSDFQKKMCLTFNGDVDLDGGDVYDDVGDVQLFSHLWLEPHIRVAIGRETFFHSPFRKHTHVYLLWAIMIM